MKRVLSLRQIIKSLDKPLLFLSILLFVYGLIMIFSASNVAAFMRYDASPYKYFIRQGFFLFAGVLASLVIILFHTKSYKYFSTAGIYLLGMILVLVLFFGVIRNDARSWFSFVGNSTIQPSEFVKIVAILFLASYYESHKDRLDHYLVVFYPIFICILIAGLIFVQPDLGTTIIFSLIVAFLFFLAPISKEIRMKVSILLLSIFLIAAIVITSGGASLLSERQMKRFNFKDPCSSEKFYGDGNQLCNSYIAMNNGGLTGVGLGNSTQKYLYLPEAHTDFIFPIILEELGFCGAAVLLFLYFLLIGRIIKIAKESYNTRGYLISMGVALYIFIHICVNLGGVMGLIPMTGVPLPFMSYGGSFTLCLVLSLTFVQRVHCENVFYQQQKSEKMTKKKTA